MQTTRHHYSSRNIFRIDYILSHYYFSNRFENLTFELTGAAELRPVEPACWRNALDSLLYVCLMLRKAYLHATNPGAARPAIDRIATVD